jgi:uncharacterized protein
MSLADQHVLFSALHVPNVFFRLPSSDMPWQVLLTFILGSGMYVIRRVSGNLILPMVLHGPWDSSLVLSVATGVEPSAAQFAVYPLAITCAIPVLLTTRKPDDGAQSAQPVIPPGAAR